MGWAETERTDARKGEGDEDVEEEEREKKDEETELAWRRPAESLATEVAVGVADEPEGPAVQESPLLSVLAPTPRPTNGWVEDAEQEQQGTATARTGGLPKPTSRENEKSSGRAGGRRRLT